ncbi:capsular polysaccharide biosynthesis protein CapF [Virgibacillus ihumii]|uniref:capsular polysaccharide biosynthesis protein CapF n=1 Tax=Virgibacillus ihumii TaxID=2686091 RepID=UPI00157D46FC|nr:capsular polysaccharide biosynthesis protein CapF [Virgibacillus ihumii]
MKILVTGAKGFIGKNLVAELKNRSYTDVFEYGRETNADLLSEYCKHADFVYHLAGVNRPESQNEFMQVNYGFTETLLANLKKHQNHCPVMIASSTQAESDNPYGNSKKAGEDLLFQYSQDTGAKVLIYRFPNAFGKWSRPNYNSVIATFCHNIAHDMPITVNDRNVELDLVYIDDIVEELINALKGSETNTGEFCQVPVTHKISLGKIVDLIYSFKKSREECSIPDVSDPFTKKLYSTYLSFLPEDQFSYDLKMNVDNRGSFTEIIKTEDRGQVSVNVSKAGITKGNHWHHTKNEKFLVVSGHGVIRFRKVDSDEVIEYFVSGEKLEVVDIPVGYTHNIENLGKTDMVTIMWANELFDPENPDTYYLEV